MATFTGTDGNDSFYGGTGNDVYYINSTSDYIYDSGGTDTAYVSTSFVKLPSSIENIIYTNGAQALPYWISALLPDQTAGKSYTALLGDLKTLGYIFPTVLPSYDTNADDARGYTAFTPVQQARTVVAMAYISSVLDLQFNKVTNAAALNTLNFASNTQDDSSGYAFYPSNNYLGNDVFLDITSYNTTLADRTFGALTLIHEIGHALGLKHPFSKPQAGGGVGDPPYLTEDEDSTTWTVMSYNYSSSQYYLQYSPLDIAALQYLYGPSKNARTGNDTYQISGSSSNFIWDGAGTDAIDVSSTNQAATIYLTPGYQGYLGSSKADKITAAGQVTVNFGTVIENLIGSNYNDKLFGNEVGNKIEGGAGNDSIEGLDGTDSLMGGTGDDSIDGGAGNDTLDGGAGNDTMYGGDGNDTFDWDTANRGGNDIYYGGKGDDEFVLDSLNDTVSEYTNEGTDIIWVAFSYSIAAQLNIESLYGFGSSSLNLIGNTNNNYLKGGTGNDSIDGGLGIDHVFISGEKYSDSIITANGSTYIIQTKTNGTDILTSIEYVIFSDRNYDLSLVSKPTYILTSTKTSFDEGLTATFTLTTTNVTSGASVPYTLSGISAADISGGSLSGNAVLNSSGVATISVTLLNDSLTEGAETLTVTAGGATASTVVNDTSKTVTYSLSANSSSVNEGSTATFTLTTTNVTSGTSVPYTLSGISAADVSGGSLSGSAVVNASGVATISVTLLSDTLTEGSETLTVSAGEASASTLVNDTSKVAATVRTGTATADTITNSAVSENIDGGVGIDTLVYTSNSSTVVISKSGVNTLVTNSTTGEVDTLTNVERLKFADTAIALDTSGVGGQAYRVYKAAFNRTPDLGGLGFWISGMDAGVSLNAVAQGFVNSAEFKAVYGASPTNAQIVTRFYDNALHRAAESGGYNYWLGALNSGQDTVAVVLASFSESPENQAGVIGVIGNGILYTPYG